MGLLDDKAIGERLKAFREALGPSKREFALTAGIDPSQYNKVEKGELSMSEGMLKKLTDTYSDLKKDEIVHGKPESSQIVPHGTLLESSYDKPTSETNNYIDNLKSKGIEISLESTARIIKKVREVLDISQLELGRRMGISKDLLLKVEKGYRNVSMLTWVLTYHYLNNMPKEDFDKIKHLFEDESLMRGTGVDEDEDDEDYRKSKAPLTEKQIEFYESMLQHQKVLLEQKDSFIKLLQDNQKK